MSTVGHRDTEGPRTTKYLSGGGRQAQLLAGDGIGCAGTALAPLPVPAALVVRLLDTSCDRLYVL